MLKRSLLKWMKIELQIKMGRMIKPQEVSLKGYFNKKSRLYILIALIVLILLVRLLVLLDHFLLMMIHHHHVEASNAFAEHIFKRFSPFKNAFTLPPISNENPMDDTRIFGNAYDDEDVGADADLNNLETTMNVSPVSITRIDKDHTKDLIIRDFNSAIQTRRMTKISDEHAMVCYINKQRRTNHKDYQNCLFAYFLSQIEPKKVIQALEDPSWIESM
ncbi:hypothetical protein Tco_1512728 [Tanacetum coccineum]